MSGCFKRETRIDNFYTDYCVYCFDDVSNHSNGFYRVKRFYDDFKIHNASSICLRCAEEKLNLKPKEANAMEQMQMEFESMIPNGPLFKAPVNNWRTT